MSILQRMSAGLNANMKAERQPGAGLPFCLLTGTSGEGVNIRPCCGETIGLSEAWQEARRFRTCSEQVCRIRAGWRALRETPATGDPRCGRQAILLPGSSADHIDGTPAAPASYFSAAQSNYLTAWPTSQYHCC